MRLRKFNVIIIIGLVAIVGILFAQLLWTRQAYSFEERKFSQKVHVALLEVARKLYEGNSQELPGENPVVKVSNDYYIVNVNNDFEPDILEIYLKNEFEKRDINTDFEYAMYNCHSDEMVYGDYVSLTNKSAESKSVYFPKHKNLVYYFAIRFPNEKTYLLGSLVFWIALSGALVVILLIYVYSIVTIMQQRKYSELQRDFINNMTHEFKTPLSSILLASNYLVKQPMIEADEKLMKYTQIIISQSNKLNNHIGEILNIAKSDSDAMSLDKKPIAPIQIIEEATENIRLKHQHATITVASEKNAKIIADAFHFSNIVYNLIDNSIKYSEKDPVISIVLSEENNLLKINFIDNGIGIPNSRISHVFDRFYRIPNSRSNEVTGFGLGLYYVKKICTLHQWKINIANNRQPPTNNQQPTTNDHQPSDGITVTLLIPIQK